MPIPIRLARGRSSGLKADPQLLTNPMERLLLEWLRFQPFVAADSPHNAPQVVAAIDAGPDGREAADLIRSKLEERIADLPGHSLGDHKFQRIPCHGPIHAS